MGVQVLVHTMFLRQIPEICELRSHLDRPFSHLVVGSRTVTKSTYLVDPVSKEIRYISKTILQVSKNIFDRFHMSTCCSGKSS